MESEKGRQVVWSGAGMSLTEPDCCLVVVAWSEAGVSGLLWIGMSLTRDCLTGHVRTKEGVIIPEWKEKKREK